MVWTGGAHAQDANLRLAIPEPLDVSGFAQFLVPRFSLKTGIRIDRLGEGAEADMTFGAQGTPVFQGMGQLWSLSHTGDPRAERFLKWLQSDVGIRTIEGFSGPDGAGFSAQLSAPEEAFEVVFEGNAAEGERLSLTLCGRCHVINESNKMNGIGATPSFRVLRGLSNWDTRFATFHLLNPHPSFTQIKDVTDPFDPSLPPPIVPMEMTTQDLEAILAYVSAIKPADLGAPLQLQ